MNIATPVAYKDESGYIQLLKDIIEEGIDTPDRTSVGQCGKLFNRTLWFDLREGQPLPTVRPIPLKWAFKELWFFMSGETNTKILENEGITLWEGNTSREFLNKRGLLYLSEGDMGNAYGYQWRNFGGQGIDQLEQTIELLLGDPYSRRIITTFWNPSDSEYMALLPCFYEHKFNVEKVEGGTDVLHLAVRSRSCDAPFGLPFNYTQYGMYLKAMAKLVGMEAGTLCINMDDVHIYQNQLAWVEELLTREIFLTSPKMEITKELKSLDDLVTLRWEDIVITGHSVNRDPFELDKPEMAI